MQVVYLCELSGCQLERLTDSEVLTQLLEQLPEEIGMTKVSEPLICKVATAKSPSTGYSGCILIAQSHIAFHTWPEERTIEIAIHSCQFFDCQRATDFSFQLFEAGVVETTYMVQQHPCRRRPMATPIHGERRNAR